MGLPKVLSFKNPKHFVFSSSRLCTLSKHSQLLSLLDIFPLSHLTHPKHDSFPGHPSKLLSRSQSLGPLFCGSSISEKPLGACYPTCPMRASDWIIPKIPPSLPLKCKESQTPFLYSTQSGCCLHLDPPLALQAAGVSPSVSQVMKRDRKGEGAQRGVFKKGFTPLPPSSLPTRFRQSISIHCSSFQGLVRALGLSVSGRKGTVRWDRVS